MPHSQFMNMLDREFPQEAEVEVGLQARHTRHRQRFVGQLLRLGLLFMHRLAFSRRWLTMNLCSQQAAVQVRIDVAFGAGGVAGILLHVLCRLCLLVAATRVGRPADPKVRDRRAFSQARQGHSRRQHQPAVGAVL